MPTNSPTLSIFSAYSNLPYVLSIYYMWLFISLVLFSFYFYFFLFLAHLAILDVVFVFYTCIYALYLELIRIFFFFLLPLGQYKRRIVTSLFAARRFSFLLYVLYIYNSRSILAMFQRV